MARQVSCCIVGHVPHSLPASFYGPLACCLGSPCCLCAAPLLVWLCQVLGAGGGWVYGGQEAWGTEIVRDYEGQRAQGDRGDEVGHGEFGGWD